MRWTWLALTQFAVLLLGSGVAGAQEPRRRTVVVAPDVPAEKGPEIAVHVENPTALVFEEPPKAVSLGGKAGRVKVEQVGNLILLLPLEELGPEERLPLIVTAADGARLVFNLLDAFTGDVDSRVLVRTARGPVEPQPAEAALAYLMDRRWSDLEGVKYVPHAESQAGAVTLKGKLFVPGFAILLVSAPKALAASARFRLRRPLPGDELPVAGIQRDAGGFKVAFKRPREETRYTLELLEPGRAPVNVATKVTIEAEPH